MTVMHPLTEDDLNEVNGRLAAAGVPVTAQTNGLPGTVLLHCALTPDTRQVARTLHTVCRFTDAPVLWAGGDVR
jgi:hypothetical protein